MMLNTADIELAFPVISILPQIGSTIRTLGLSDNVLYNIEQFGGPSNSVANVSGLVFKANCSSVTSARQAGFVDLGSDNLAYVFHVDNAMEDLRFLPTPGAINVISANRTDKLSSSAVFLALVPPVYVEDFEASSNHTPISPSIIDQGCMVNHSGNCMISEISIVGCTITATNVTALIDDNGRLVDFSPAPWNVYPDPWNLDNNAPANWTLQAAPDFLAPVGQLAVLTPSSTKSNKRTVGFTNANVTSARPVSLMEEIVWDAVFAGETSIGIVQLEDALSNIIWAGLSLSILALITSFVLTVQKSDKEPEHYQLSRISNSGILQVTWLLSHPQIARKTLLPMSQIVIPDLKQLRKTGATIQLPFRDLLEKAALEEKDPETQAALESDAAQLA
ncbi:hypothetical protein EIP86_003227 [Pleurotus ostreatoroseus]|nr:hypothetical protein EIP86_003227 [Pleurotus ostreatoroseus]